MTGNSITETYTYDCADEPPSVAVVRAVADATDHDVLTLRPLQDVVETDALNALLGEQYTDVTIRFSYEGCHVEAAPESIVVHAPTAS